MEPEIVDVLLPEIDDEVIDVNMVQRMTDSGRRVKFVISVAVGNNDGFVGFGERVVHQFGVSGGYDVMFWVLWSVNAKIDFVI